jgi:hypothetical protein
MVTALDVSPAADSPSQAWCLVMPAKRLRARIAAHESNPVAVVRTLNVAEVSYAQAHRETGFPGSLGDLRSVELIDDNSRWSSRTGILSDSRLRTYAGGGADMKYQIFAVPDKYNQSGVQMFLLGRGRHDQVRRGSAENCFQSGAPLT